MFKILRAEMYARKVTQKKIAAIIGVSMKTVDNKISGKTDFTSTEMYKIQREFFPDMTIDQLFKKSA